MLRVFVGAGSVDMALRREFSETRSERKLEMLGYLVRQ